MDDVKVSLRNILSFSYYKKKLKLKNEMKQNVNTTMPAKGTYPRNLTAQPKAAQLQLLIASWAQ